MRYVLLRDDDTNAFTPVACLERLYRPFLDRGLPVNLAVIPAVRRDAAQANGRPEGFLPAQPPVAPARVPVGQNRELIQYLRDNPGFHVVQHGCDHSFYEFDSPDRHEVAARLAEGTRWLQAAGFAVPETFVAPYDKLSRASLAAVARRFRVLSTGWFELRRLPWSWWPGYLWKKLVGKAHWRVGRTLLLSHPGCLLSCHRPRETMLAAVQHAVRSRPLTVLVTHWWEYFRAGGPEEEFIDVLHQTAAFLASTPDVRVLSFEELARTGLPRRREWLAVTSPLASPSV